MTARQIMTASAGFSRPYGSLSVARSDLLDLTRRGWLARQEIPSLGPGQCELIYFLKRKARQLVPELAELPTRSPVFRPVRGSFEHSLAISELVCAIERSAAVSQGRVQLMDYLRDRELRSKVDARPYEIEARHLIPDYTWLVRVDRKPQLLFVELQNQGAVISPGRRASIARSFQGKLWRYKVFLDSFGEDPKLRRLLHAHDVEQLPGFRVLVVSTRTEKNLSNLVDAAGDFRSLFYFATLGTLSQGNLFLDPVWTLPTRARRAIVD